MSWLLFMAILAAYLIYAMSLRPRGQQDEILYCQTPDGARAALHRFKPTAQTKGQPVLLVHGVATSYRFFDLGGEAADLSTWLRDQGYDVFVAELRSESWATHRRGSILSRHAPDFDTYVENEIPTFVTRIKELYPDEDVFYVGHSMGGLLGWAYSLSVPQHRLKSITMLASCPMAIGGSVPPVGHRIMFGLRNVGPLAVWPYTTFLLAPFGKIPPMIAGFRGLFCGMNSPQSVGQKVLATTAPLPAPLASQLVSVRTDRGLVDRSGEPYADRPHASRPPMAFITADEDGIFPTGRVQQALAECFNDGKVEHLSVGRNSGDAVPFGHVDIAVSPRAKERVFPAIAAWLSRGELPKATNTKTRSP